MPESKSRHAHKHPHHSKHPEQHSNVLPTHPKQKKTDNKAVILATVFFAVLGLGIGFFINAASIIVMLTGAVLGAALGYVFGVQVNKSLTGK
jgi:ABC-type nickel/cobalt efflux system permease component RcnA